jgi:malyl-CoA/(S)-citramalyl-CoA lyase
VLTHRSVLVVPTADAELMTRGTGTDADVIMVDLDGADERSAARESAAAALLAGDWRAGSVRIDRADSAWCHDDVVALVRSAGQSLDLLTIADVTSGDDVLFVASLLDALERPASRRISVAAVIESPQGLARIDEIASTRPDRLRAIAFDADRYGAAVQGSGASIGRLESRYPVITEDASASDRALYRCDEAHYPMSAIALACRANGLLPIDGPFRDAHDAEGYLVSARRAAALGYRGKWATDPAQVELANRIFTRA